MGRHACRPIEQKKSFIIPAGYIHAKQPSVVRVGEKPLKASVATVRARPNPFFPSESNRKPKRRWQKTITHYGLMLRESD
jgi:hypothetical protein